MRDDGSQSSSQGSSPGGPTEGVGAVGGALAFPLFRDLHQQLHPRAHARSEVVPAVRQNFLVLAAIFHWTCVRRWKMCRLSHETPRTTAVQGFQG